MPKRNGISTEGGSRSKRSRDESPSKKRKSQRASPRADPLNLRIVQWHMSQDNSMEHICAPTISTDAIQESGPTTWPHILERYRRDPHGITDVTFLTSDGQSVAAHSLILRIRVPYFSALLMGKHITPGSGESGTTARSEIVLDWADRSVLNDLIDIAYLQKTVRNITSDRLYGLYKVAMHIAWEELETACFEEFLERLSVDNCLDWLEWSVANKNHLVKQRVANYAAAHLDQLHDAKDQELLRLSLEAHLAIAKFT